MIEYLDGYDLYNMIRLQLAAEVSKIIVVEGEEDYDLLLDFFRALPVRIVSGYGKPISLAAARLSENDADDVRYLIDADFDRITAASDSYPSKVIATDRYDLVVDIIELNDDVLKKIVRLNSQGGNPPSAQSQVDLARKASTHIGRVRLASHVQNWCLNMKAFPIHLCLPQAITGDIDEARVVTLAINRTANCATTEESVIAELDAQGDVSGHGAVHINGHDLLSALTHVGRAFAGAKAKTDYTMQFALAVGSTELARVPAIQSLSKWVLAA